MSELDKDEVSGLYVGVRLGQASLVDKGLGGASVDGKAPDKDVVLQIQEQPLGKACLGPCGDVVVGYGRISEINDPVHGLMFPPSFSSG